MEKLKVMTIFGTRPEAIKMAPVILALGQDERFESTIAVTAQHREMLDQVLDLFGLTPQVDLDIMTANQSLTQITHRALVGLEEVLVSRRPDIVLVQGDTTTVFAAALAAFYQKIPVGHVEAGLRTDDRYNPYPEEMNRRLGTVLTDLHFAPTRQATENLLRNGVQQKDIFLTGNTVTDALYHILDRGRAALPSPLEEMKAAGRRLLLVETHRRENLGEPMRQICMGLRKLADAFPDVFIAFSLHKNPRVREIVCPVLESHPQVALFEPVEYHVLVNIMRDCHLVLTDSGGLQEEAPSLGKPVLVLRTTTERPEGIETGNALLVGTSAERIFEEGAALLTDGARYDQMSRAVNPYGDGRAAGRIRQAIAHRFLGAAPPDSFEPHAVERVFS